MFLTSMGNRRSRGTRAAALATLLVMVSGSLRLGWAAPPTRAARVEKGAEAWRPSQRVRPVAIEDLDGKASPDTLWKLFDGDPGTGLETAARFRLTFAEPVAVTDVAGFTGATGRLTLRDGAGASEVGHVDVASAAGRWARIAAPATSAVRSVVVQWTPAQTGAVFPELEVWGRVNSPAPAERGNLADEIFQGVPEGAEAFSAKEPIRTISAATPSEGRAFSVELPFDRRAIERAFLVYELDNLPHFTAARRSVNGGPIVGGFGASVGAKGGLQIEELAPALLREGGNTLRFEPLRSDDPVGYRVSGLRLVVTHATSGHAVEATGSEDVRVAREGGGFEAVSGDVRHLRFAAASQPRELAINVPRAQAGRLVVAAGRASNRGRMEVDLATLKPGWNRVALGALPAVDEVTLGFEGGKETKMAVSDLLVSGSPLPGTGTAGVRVTYPLHGECVNHQVHVRGIASDSRALRAAGSQVKNAVLEPGAFSFTASEKELGGGAGKPFNFTVEAGGDDGRRSAATIRIEGCTERPPVVAGWDGKPVQPKDDVGAPYGAVVKAASATTLSFGGVELNVPAGAVDADVRVTIRPLSPSQVPTLEAGMTNVTQGGRAFRLGPRGMVFKKPVTLSLPVDRTRVAESDGVRTFYFDEPAKQWREVPVASHARERVVAQTTHFTDFIAATLALPEHPGLQSLDPTSLKQIKVADPGAGVQLMAPPEPNAQGTANLSYPIEVPPGRLGMEPHLAISYDSSRGNGWLGVGWDLSISTIEVDTRFGVPKYDGTEKYLLDGEALTPASSAPAGAPAGTYYVRRNEGRFDWIQRVGTGTNFYWVVTDKAGVKYTYGQSDAAVLAPMNGSAPVRTRIYQWFLEKAEDIHLNQVVYTYARLTGSNGDPFVQVYPASINYTRNNGSSTVAPYSVVFTLQSGTRPDSFSTGRPGFQVLTQRLLDSVDVKNGTATVRRYKLNYYPNGGDFGKSLLQNIQVFGKGPTSTAIAQHELTYFQTPRDANNNPKIFSAPTFHQAMVPYTTIQTPSGTGSTKTTLTDLSSHSDQEGVSILVGSGMHSATTTRTVSTLEDMNGDGLPDMLPLTAGSNMGARQSLTGGVGVNSPASMVPINYWDLAPPYTTDVNRFLRSSYNLLLTTGGQDFGNFSEALAIHADVNGDGLVDQVTGAADDTLHVRYNRGNFGGFTSEVVLPGYLKSGLGFQCGDIWNGTFSSAAASATASSTLAAAATNNQFPSTDVVTKWVAPFAGQIRITGKVKRQEPGGDGMNATLYLGNTMLWERFIAPDDMSDCTPIDAAPAVGNGCGVETAGFLRTVAKGDRLYTRVSALNDAEHDGLLWDTTIQYLNSPGSEAATQEAWGPMRYKWSEANDQRVVGAFYKPWVAKFTGDAMVNLTVAKDPSADKVRMTLEKYRPSTQSNTVLGTYDYDATGTVSPGDGTFDVPAPGLLVGDEIHVTISSDTPIDPATFRVLPVVNYTWACRPDPFHGGLHCGQPRCAALPSSEGNGSVCTFEYPLGTGPSNDPMAAYPVMEAELNQIAPSYYPLKRWAYAPTTPPNPPTTSLDGRKVARATASNPQLRLCWTNLGTSPTPALFMIQGVNKLIKKESVSLTITGDIPACISAPNAPLNGGEQVIFSVYSDAPLPAGITFSALINGTNATVERYYRDASLPQLDRFPWVGGIESMSSGYHDFYLGLWNGNEAFNENLIVREGNGSYQPMFAGPLPKQAAQTGQNLAFFDVLGWLEDAWGYVSAFGAYLWDSAVGLVKYVGSACVKGIRWLGSVMGKFMTWVLCEGTSDASEHQAKGIRVTETHNAEQGFSAGVAGVSRNTGFSAGGLDLVDMNGDRFPDQVSAGGIRYASIDPQSGAGRFCPAAPSPNCTTTGMPAIQLPETPFRISNHAMHSYNLGVSITGGADAQSVNSSGMPAGVQPSVGIETLASQGYSHQSRDLRDVNGDGLPDIVNANGYGLRVRLNYGYGFGNPIDWGSPAWSVPSPTVGTLLNPATDVIAEAFVAALQWIGASFLGSDPPTSQTIRLDEEGHKGGAVSVGLYSYGLDQDYSRTLVDLVDVNGDGLPDQLMKLPGQPYRVKMNSGTGFGTEVTMQVDEWPSGAAMFSNPGRPIPISSADALGFSRGDSSSHTFSTVLVSGSSGNGGRKSIIELTDIDGDGRIDHVLKNADADDQTVDANSSLWARLNQSGKSNLLASVTGPLGGSISLDYTRQLNMVGETTWAGGDSLKVDLPDGRWTLSKVSVSDGRGNTYTDNIDHYVESANGRATSGVYDRLEREFLGFARVRIVHGSAGRGGPVEGDGSEKWLFFHNQDYYQRGLRFAEYDIAPDGKVLRGSVTKYDLGVTAAATASSKYVTGTSELELTYEGGITSAQIAEPLAPFDRPQYVPADTSVYRLTSKGYDGTGNLTTMADAGDPGNPNDDLLYQIRYATFSGQHFTSPDRVIMTDSTSSVVGQREATYTLTNNRPLLTQVRDLVFRGKQPGTGTPYTGQVTAYNLTYDPADFGNPKTFAEPNTYTLTYTYDITSRSHVKNVADSFGYQSSTTYNFDYGVPATTTDANGQVITYEYDAFGRVSKVWGPTDPTSGTPTIQMTYSKGSTTAAAVPWAKTQHKDFQSSTDTIDTVAFVDGLGRTIQTKKESEVLQSNGTTVAGFSISGLTVFDTRGRVLAQHQPFFDSATAATTLSVAPQKNPTVFAYDGLGRVTSATTADNALTSQSYYIANTSVATDDALPGPTRFLAVAAATDANNHTTRVYRDAANRIVANKAFATIAAVRQPVVTTYEYDPAGNVDLVTDARGNVTSAVYDSLGRMVSLVSPDAGTTEWRFSTGALLMEKQTSKIRGASQFIKYTYSFNRLATIDYPTLPDVVYSYGSSTETGNTNFNRAGRLKSVTMEGGSEQRKYDAFGNVVETTTTLNHINSSLAAPVVTMKFAYDWLGRMKTMTFPQTSIGTNWVVPTGDGEVITYTYDKGGEIDKISGKATPTSTPENYLNDIGYDEFGSRKTLVSGNGISNAYTYSPARHFLTNVDATGKAVSGTVKFHGLAYGYDPVGNILTVTNTTPQAAIQATGTPVGVGPLAITNTYDELDRLLTSTGQYRGHTTFGHAYSSTFSYDTIDNITQKTQSDQRLDFNAGDPGLSNGRPGAVVVPTTYSLTYNFPTGKVHQPGTINDTNAGSTQTRTMNFDGDGNFTGDSIGSTTRTIAWDEEDRMKSVTVGGVVKGRFLYSPAGERTQKQVAGSTPTTTFYFNQFLVIDGSRQVTTHIYAGETRIASKTQSAQLTTPIRNFYHPDNVGSTSYISDASQNLVQHERYFPFGERWNENGLDELVTANNIRRDWLFTSKELDRDTNFYYFGARYMDPRTSVWLSADPILRSYLYGKVNGGVFRPGNLGLYTYGWNNPIVVRDPTGLAGREGSAGSPTGGSDPAFQARQAAISAALVAEQQARVEEYRAWYKSLSPSHQDAVRRSNAGGAAAATDAATRKVTATAQCGGVAITGIVQGATIYATGMIAEAIFPAAGLMSVEEEVGGGGAVGGGSTRVSRWMSREEFAEMERTGMVQQSRSGTTHVALPADPEAFMSQAKVGSLHVEFDVPAASVRQTQEGWGKIIGPDSLEGRLAARKGLPTPQMPAATNVQHTATKFR